MKALLLTIGLVLGMFVATQAHALNESVDPSPTYNTPETEAGAQFGKFTTSKIGFHGVAPVAQRAGVAQVSVSSTAAVSSGPFGYATADQANAVIVLLNEMRAVLVEKGLMKGAE